MSRYRWIHPDFETIEVGDKFVVQWGRGWGSRDNLYSRPVEVVRVTETQFALEDPNTDGKTINFTRSYGKSVGTYSNNHAKRATAEFLKEVDEHNKGVQDRRADERSEADQKETELRERYHATTITDEKVQKVLQPIRRLAEKGRAKLEDLLEIANEATIDAPWNLVRYITDHPGAYSLEEAMHYKESAEQIHARLVQLVLAYEGGEVIANKQNGRTTYYEQDGAPEDGLLGVLVLEINNTVNAISDSYFDGYDKKEYEREFINDLREIAGVKYAYGRLTVVEDRGSEHAA